MWRDPPPSSSWTTVVFRRGQPFGVFLHLSYEDIARTPQCGCLSLVPCPSPGTCSRMGSPLWTLLGSRHHLPAAPQSRSYHSPWLSGLGRKLWELFDLLGRKTPSTSKASLVPSRLKIPIHLAICPHYGLRLMISISDTRFQLKQPQTSLRVLMTSGLHRRHVC